MKDGRVVYEHNVGDRHETLVSDTPVPPGHVEIAFEFTAEKRTSSRPYREASGVGRLYINGELAGSLDLAHITSAPYFMLFSTFNIGQARVSPVSEHFAMPFQFSGVLEKVEVQLK
jgi:hypothetical protein